MRGIKEIKNKVVNRYANDDEKSYYIMEEVNHPLVLIIFPLLAILANTLFNSGKPLFTNSAITILMVNVFLVIIRYCLALTKEKSTYNEFIIGTFELSSLIAILFLVLAVSVNKTPVDFLILLLIFGGQITIYTFSALCKIKVEERYTNVDLREGWVFYLTHKEQIELTEDLLTRIPKLFKMFKEGKTDRWNGLLEKEQRVTVDKVIYAYKCLPMSETSTRSAVNESLFFINDSIYLLGLGEISYELFTEILTTQIKTMCRLLSLEEVESKVKKKKDPKEKKSKKITREELVFDKDKALLKVTKFKDIK
mgnify:FL=1